FEPENVCAMRHLTMEELAGFRRRRLEPSALIQSSAHLAVCVVCRDRVVSDSETSVSIAHLQRVFERHLADSELIACADEPEAENSFACAHLDHCPSCRSELRELQAFRRRVRATSVLLSRHS